jgi:hypothetical protein
MSDRSPAPAPPRVFISYSHDSNAHRTRVLALSERLRKDGIDADLDQYVEGTPPETWARWMLNRLDWADFVLLICTPTYYRRFRAQEEPGKGEGVDWEGAAITNAIYAAPGATRKFVPVLFDPADEDAIPEPLKGHGFYRLDSEIGYRKLYDFLLGKPPQEPPPQRTRRLRIPNVAWVKIPSGPFIYQRGETRQLPTFWIARYPVTNAQYQTFTDDGGYDEPRWWRDLERPEPASPRWPQANRPRTNVDWYEAVAFTRWLNARLGLPEGSIRLPTELEWEKVARGTEGRTYPWGAEYRSGFANVDETEYGTRKSGWHLEQTTAVGLYPHGRSPYGVEDLAGTVWEWCLNKYDDEEAVAPDTSDAPRAVRGGSWDDDPDAAGAGNRLGDPPRYRNVNQGFRLLSSVPVEPVR